MARVRLTCGQGLWSEGIRHIVLDIRYGGRLSSSSSTSSTSSFGSTPRSSNHVTQRFQPKTQPLLLCDGRSIIVSIEGTQRQHLRKMAVAGYELAFTLHGHTSDVRHICSPSPDIPLLLSGSRDGSAIVWGPSSKEPEGAAWEIKMRVEGPEKKFISCVGMVRWQGEGGIHLKNSRANRFSAFIDGIILRHIIIVHAPFGFFSSVNT